MAGSPDLKTNLEITLTFWGLFKKFSLHSMLVEVQKKKNGRGEVKYIYLSLAVFYWGLVEGDIIPLSSFRWVAQISKSPQKTILHCAAVSSQEIWATQHSQASYWQEDDVTQYTTGVGETQVYIVYFCHLFFFALSFKQKRREAALNNAMSTLIKSTLKHALPFQICTLCKMLYFVQYN